MNPLSIRRETAGRSNGMSRDSQVRRQLAQIREAAERKNLQEIRQSLRCLCDTVERLQLGAWCAPLSLLREDEDSLEGLATIVESGLSGEKGSKSLRKKIRKDLARWDEILGEDESIYHKSVVMMAGSHPHVIKIDGRKEIIVQANQEIRDGLPLMRVVVMNVPAPTQVQLITAATGLPPVPPGTPPNPTLRGLVYPLQSMVSGENRLAVTSGLALNANRAAGQRFWVNLSFGFDNSGQPLWRGTWVPVSWRRPPSPY